MIRTQKTKAEKDTSSQDRKNGRRVRVRISQAQAFRLFQLIDGVVSNVEAVQKLVLQAALLKVQRGQLVTAVLVPARSQEKINYVTDACWLEVEEMRGRDCKSYKRGRGGGSLVNLLYKIISLDCAMDGKRLVQRFWNRSIAPSAINIDRDKQ